MKNKFFTMLALCAVMSLTSCSDDSSESYNDANNNNTTAKYIKSLVIVPTGNTQETKTLTVNYDANGRVTNTSDGTDTSYFVYQNNNLTTVTGSGDPLNIADLYQSPFDAYEVGDVVSYDSNGNPTVLRLFERDDTGMIVNELRGELLYDNTPNPFFHTLKAAGIIDVLDGVRLNFSMTPQAQNIILAKMLLPVNNPKKAVVKNMSGQVTGQMVADYVYDAAGYPSSATFTETSEGQVNVYVATYTYKQ